MVRVIGSGGYPLAASFRTLEYGASGLSWVNVYATVFSGTYTEESLALEIYTQFVAALQARQTEMYNPRVGAASAMHVAVTIWPLRYGRDDVASLCDGIWPDSAT